MLQIKYPEDRDKFHKEYIEALGINKDMRKRFKNLLKKDPFLIKEYDLDKVLLSSFEELKELRYLYLSTKDKKLLQQLLNYDKEKYKKFQPDIKNFFEEKLNIKTCYFCNIDFVNSFRDIDDYHDGLDFIQRATEEELKKINGIGQVTAEKIVRERINCTKIDELPVNDKIKNNLNKIVLKTKHSHFTLDHLLDKGTNPVLALSLYNFVPSCYSCNSKFKGKRQFKDSRLSPTSENFSFDSHVKFKLYFYNGKDTSSIRANNDFVLDFSFTENEDGYKDYIDVFKLKGRYIFHKDEVLKLVKQKEKYSQSQIDSMANALSISSEQIKRDIFGKELFDGKNEEYSMLKFKKDIARNIGIF